MNLIIAGALYVLGMFVWVLWRFNEGLIDELKETEPYNLLPARTFIAMACAGGIIVSLFWPCFIVKKTIVYLKNCFRKQKSL